MPQEWETIRGYTSDVRDQLSNNFIFSYNNTWGYDNKGNIASPHNEDREEFVLEMWIKD
jgi:hypothetical protein